MLGRSDQTDAADVSLSLRFLTDLSSAVLSNGQSVKELVEDDVS